MYRAADTTQPSVVAGSFQIFPILIHQIEYKLDQMNTSVLSGHDFLSQLSLKASSQTMGLSPQAFSPTQR